MSAVREVGEDRRAPARPVGPAELVLLACIPLGVVALLVGFAVTGALTAPLLVDPGVLVTRGLPIARVLADGSAALTIGLLTLATFALPGATESGGAELRGVLSFSQWTAVRWAARSAAVWVAASAAVLAFTAADVLGAPLGSDVFSSQFLFFATGLELGQQLLASSSVRPSSWPSACSRGGSPGSPSPRPSP
ncbi:hypothetical protein [Naasia aerilata]|uniref:Uncharacterized protein n=1 Tax=Naasia aerilata TaxID=1162966 RepID=A0ABN6XU22_9MICO|nr:hypothetical protein [Naasia aerilata]BDZ47402.1 hypothetical protein GCM10025866_33110 [Naasia aerilata]